MELLILCWRLLLLTLVPIAVTISLVSPIIIIIATPAVASVTAFSGWLEALVFLARLHKPGEVSLDVGSCQHLLAILLLIVFIAWPRTRCALAELVRGWFPITPWMEWTWLFTVVDL